MKQIRQLPNVLIGVLTPYCETLVKYVRAWDGGLEWNDTAVARDAFAPAGVGQVEVIDFEVHLHAPRESLPWSNDQISHLIERVYVEQIAWEDGHACVEWVST
jgi:hypothetical protein